MLSRYQTPSGQRRQTRQRHLSMTLLAIATLAAATPHRRPILVYNPSPSAPLGLYIAHPPAPLTRGDWVLIDAPLPAKDLADRRGYLPASVPMLKRVIGLSGDTVCAVGRQIWVDKRWVAQRLAHDAKGRDLPQWQGCHVLGKDEVFVLNSNPKSFDSRYFGAVTRRAVRARVTPL